MGKMFEIMIFISIIIIMRKNVGDIFFALFLIVLILTVLKKSGR